MPEDFNSESIEGSDQDITGHSKPRHGSLRELETQRERQDRQWQQQQHDVRSELFTVAIRLAEFVIISITVVATILYLRLMWNTPEEYLQHLWQFLTKFAMGAIAGGAAVIKIYRINIFPKNTAPPSD